METSYQLDSYNFLIFYTEKRLRMTLGFIFTYIRQLPFAPIGELTGQVVQNATTSLTSLTQIGSTRLPALNAIL